MKITLIRHGKTQSNVEHRYQGAIDDPLCQAGIDFITEWSMKKPYDFPERLVCSPKLRCLQTAKLFFPEFPEKDYLIEEQVKESNFGIFEGKNHQELQNDPVYVKWLASNGEDPIPGGESKGQMSQRCIEGFRRQVCQALRDGIHTLTFVVHGGTIMALMERFAFPAKLFYEYYIGNGEGFTFTIDNWSDEGRYPVTKISPEE